MTTVCVCVCVCVFACWDSGAPQENLGEAWQSKESWQDLVNHLYV